MARAPLQRKIFACRKANTFFPPRTPPAISPSLPPSLRCRNPERIWVRCQANVLPANKSCPVHPGPRCSLLIPLWVWLNVTVSKPLALSRLWRFPPSACVSEREVSPLKCTSQQPTVWDKCPPAILILLLSLSPSLLSPTRPRPPVLDSPSRLFLVNNVARPAV